MKSGMEKRIARLEQLTLRRAAPVNWTDMEIARRLGFLAAAQVERLVDRLPLEPPFDADPYLGFVEQVAEQRAERMQ